MHLSIDFCPQVPQTQMHLGLESLRSWLQWAGRNPVDRIQRKGAKDKHTRPKDEHGVPQPRVQMQGCANPAGNVLRHTPLQLGSPAYPLVLSAPQPWQIWLLLSVHWSSRLEGDGTRWILTGLQRSTIHRWVLSPKLTWWDLEESSGTLPSSGSWEIGQSQVTIAFWARTCCHLLTKKQFGAMDATSSSSGKTGNFTDMVNNGKS